MNFTPTRPIAEFAREYVQAIWTMYDPEIYSQTLPGAVSQHHSSVVKRPLHAFLPLQWSTALGPLSLAPGLRRPEIRVQFWQQLWIILRRKPQFLSMYLGLCAAGEHFF